MKRKARLLCICLTAAMIAWLAGCTRKPAYSEIDPNKTSSNQNQNRNQPSEGQPATTPATPQPAAPSTPAPSAPTAALKSPSFVDSAKGEIKDLPNYPRSQRLSVQIGPVQGVNTMSLALKSVDPMDKITAFYEQVIKANKWTVTNKIIDPELSEWNLKKGDAHNGKVQVKKDLKTSEMNIILVRTEKLSEPAK